MKEFRIRNYEVFSGKIKENREVRFAFISDLHGLSFGENNCELVSAIKQCRPDAILVTGDLNVRTILETLKTAAVLMKGLGETYPVYYALGNHEYKLAISREHQKQYLEYEKYLKECGVHVLRNEKACMKVGSTDFWIHGLEIPLKYYQKPRSPVLTAKEVQSLVGMPKEEGFHILLAHNPKYGNAYFSWGADLILSVHYHGGIWRISEHHGLSCPQYLLLPPFCCGDFHRGEQTMVVSAGLGEHTVPIRIHNPRELLTVTVKPLEKSTITM